MASKSLDLHKTPAGWRHTPLWWHSLCREISQIVKDLVIALEECDYEKILFLIKKNREALQKLEKSSGVILETPALMLLCNIAEKYGAAGKFSGAGGGDCGIAVCTSKEVAQKISRAWQDHGILLLDDFL